MNKPLKLIAIGNSTGIVIPKEVLAKLRLKQGDHLSVSDIPGGVTLRAADVEFDRQMERAEAIMREDRDILRVLAQ